MNYTADFLIEKRKEKWEQYHDLEYDKNFRNAVAHELINNKYLRDSIKNNPEKLVELVFIVVDKNQQTKPFFFNEVQQEFIKILNKAIDDYNNGLITEISLLTLKGRQQGFTTLVTAYQLATSILHPNFQGFTLADESDNTETIFQNKAKFPYSQLPEILKPTEKYNNKRQLLFEKINSSWAADTATENVGRSRTINFFHGSECAFWKCGIAKIQAALGEAFTKNCIKIYETTANGFNEFKDMWDSGVHINCFFEWWKTSEYRLNIPSEELKNEFINNINVKKDWIYERLKWLRDSKKLDIEQLFWYFKKYEGYLDKETIKQEYPCSPDEAFLMSGAAVFDNSAIIMRLDNLPRIIHRGYFSYEYDGINITSIKWITDPTGFIDIFNLPNSPEMTNYCIGGDTAGEGSDYFVAQVLDARTGLQVARLRHQMDEDLYTKQVYCLGKYYNNALIGIETNFSTYPIMELSRLGYKNQYVRKHFDTYTNKLTKSFGFRTTSLTRSPIISNLVMIIRESVNLIQDKDTLDELKTIVRNEKGKAEAPEGGHDDLMMALAIAYHIKEQVRFDTKPIIEPSIYNFEKEKPKPKDYGERIQII